MAALSGSTIDAAVKYCVAVLRQDTPEAREDMTYLLMKFTYSLLLIFDDCATVVSCACLLASVMASLRISEKDSLYSLVNHLYKLAGCHL